MSIVFIFIFSALVSAVLFFIYSLIKIEVWYRHAGHAIDLWGKCIHEIIKRELDISFLEPQNIYQRYKKDSYNYMSIFKWTFEDFFPGYKEELDNLLSEK